MILFELSLPAQRSISTFNNRNKLQKKFLLYIFINYSHLLTQTVQDWSRNESAFLNTAALERIHESRMNFWRIIHTKMVEKHVPALFLELFVAFSEGGP